MRASTLAEANEIIADLEETVRQLREAIRPPSHDYDLLAGRLGFPPTKSECAVLTGLAAGGILSTESLTERIEAYRRAEGVSSPASVKVIICRLRKRLPEGVVIDSVWGEGYRMPAAAIARLWPNRGSPRL